MLLEKSVPDQAPNATATHRPPLNTTAEEALLRQWEPLARRLAHRFEWAAEREDLEQVARLALLHAARRFDPARGSQFSSFVFLTILGDLHRYIRDCGPAIRIPRRWWDLRLRLKQAVETVEQGCSREPTVPELAEQLGVSEEDVVGAMGVHELFHPTSLDEPPAGRKGEENELLAGKLGADDPLLEVVELRIALRQAMEALPARLRDILERRYFQGRSQQEVGRALGISQMHVSRLERQALVQLRAEVRRAWGLEPEAPADGPTSTDPQRSEDGSEMALTPA
jgi:RNA polymerase sigma-B factor